VRRAEYESPPEYAFVLKSGIAEKQIRGGKPHMKLTQRFVALVGCLGFVIAIAGHPRAASTGYVQTNLISDLPGVAKTTDPNLLNPWGLAFFPGASPFWINENNSVNGTSALYFADGAVNAGLPAVIVPPGAPSGIVANLFVGTGAFEIPDPTNPNAVNGSDGPALFIFDTENGTIDAWNAAPFVLPGLPNPLSALIVVDNSGGGAQSAVYKGLAIGKNTANGPLIYATNFRSGKVEVYDTNFKSPTPPLSGTFTDPKVQAGYAPFGIQNINGNIWVTYAMQDAPKHDPVNKPAHGFVSVFDIDGNLLQHFAQHGHLNSPWGVALAPASFGQFSNDILIGNFDDGKINAFDPKTGHWLGALSGPDGSPLVNDGLWALTFGGALNSNGTPSSPNTLFFSAGLNDETDGLFGRIDPAP
jgi:uncharacterized protein (TIGR03118 family)